MLALAGTFAIGAAGAASAGTNERLAMATIDIKGQGQNLRFQGDDEVTSGYQLEVNNLTDPNADGAHTFSLVSKQALPDSGRKRKRCGNLTLKVCERIFAAHDPFGMPTEDVENGILGWDLPFDKETDGDSWYTDEQDQSTTRAVSAEPGEKLRYFCAVHPFMKGKIQVLPEP